MTPGDMLITLTCLRVSGFVAGIASPFLLSILRARVAAAVLYKTIDRVPETIDPSSTIGYFPPATPPGEQRGKIEFSSVHFAYSTRRGKPVLAGVSWTAEPGEVIALVGESGAGKSTCVALLCRLYDVVGGTVRLDSVDVREWNLRALRLTIGVVQQEPVLFSASVFENVTVGRDGLTAKEVVWACKMANAHEFIVKLKGRPVG